MMVHRLLTKYLDQGGRTVSEQKYEALCEHSSNMEQIASNAERASHQVQASRVHGPTAWDRPSTVSSPV